MFEINKLEEIPDSQFSFQSANESYKVDDTDSRLTSEPCPLRQKPSVASMTFKGVAILAAVSVHFYCLRSTITNNTYFSRLGMCMVVFV